MADRYVRREQAKSVQATELVHEAYLRLLKDKSPRWQNRTHFLAIAAISMRRLLVERARARGALKRGGDHVQVTLDDALLVGQAPDDDASIDLVALDRALTSLAAARRRPGAHRRAQILRWTVGRGNGRGARDLAGHRQAPLDDRQGVAAARAAADELAVTNADWTRVNELFHQALELPRDQRGAFLAQACGGDEALRLEIASLLGAHDEADDFIERPATTPADLAATSIGAGPRRPDDRSLPDRARSSASAAWASSFSPTTRGSAVRSRSRRSRRASPRTRAGESVCGARRARRRRSPTRASRPSTRSRNSTTTSTLPANTCPARRCATSCGRGPLPASRVIDTALALARALEAAHDRGVVHRDLKPENVIRTPAGDVKILDFGLARMRDVPQQPAAEITAEGALLGTPAYMSPEQIRGDAVDFRTDLFALGIMLYELATGAHPFSGSNPASTIARILESQPPHVADRVPAMLSTAVGLGDLDRIIARCLEKHPDARYQSTHDLGGSARGGAKAGGAAEPRSHAEAAAEGPPRRRALGGGSFTRQRRASAISACSCRSGWRAAGRRDCPTRRSFWLGSRRRSSRRRFASTCGLPCVSFPGSQVCSAPRREDGFDSPTSSSCWCSSSRARLRSRATSKWPCSFSPPPSARWSRSRSSNPRRRGPRSATQVTVPRNPANPEPLGTPRNH